MGPGQPGVHGHEAGLGPEPHQGAQADSGTQTDAGCGQPGRGIHRAQARQQEEAEPHPRSTEVRDGQVDEDRVPNRAIGMGNQDRGRRQDGHQLPASQECARVTSGEDQEHRGDEEAGQGSLEPCPRRPGQIARSEDQRRHGHHSDGEGEERAEGIEPQARMDAAAEYCSDPVSAVEKDPGHHADTPDAQCLQP